jgi:hypothetical protein
MTTMAESIAERLAERDALATELAAVKAWLTEALRERDAAQAQLSRYQRTGW